MPKASDFKYKFWFDDYRQLGPPYQRFPEMHPEHYPDTVNAVYLEIPTVGFANMFFCTLFLGGYIVLC